MLGIQMKRIISPRNSAIVAIGAISFSIFAGGISSVSAMNVDTNYGSGPTSGGTAVAIQVGDLLQDETVIQVSNRGATTAALTSSGRLYTWGEGSNGELGNGSTTDSSTPVALNMTGVLAGETISQVSMGVTFGVALTASGKLVSWGSGSNGVLGNGATAGSSVPVLVDMSGVLAGETVVRLSAIDHTVVLTASGKLFSWGAGGGLGNGSSVNSSVPVAVDMTGVLAGEKIIDVSTGSSSTAVLTESGRVFTWGSSNFLGNGAVANSTVPVAVDTTGVLAGETITQMSAGVAHVVVLAESGRLFTWGLGSGGRLGNGANANAPFPVAVNMSGVLAGETITKISTGGSHTIVLASSGKLFSWGLGTNGRLGNGAAASSTVPVAVDMTGVLAGKKVTQLASGVYHTVVVSDLGEAFSWGAGTAGQLGNGSFTDRSSPVAVDLNPLLDRVTEVTFGDEIAMINSADQNSVSVLSPAHIPGLVRVVVTTEFTGAHDVGFFRFGIGSDVRFDNASTNYSVSTGDRAVGAGTHMVTVSLADASGNLIGGLASSLVATAAESLGTGAVSAFSESIPDGTYTATVTSSVAGNKTITVHLNGTPLVAKGNSTASFAEALEVVDPNPTATIPAGGSHTFRPQIRAGSTSGATVAQAPSAGMITIDPMTFAVRFNADQIAAGSYSFAIHFNDALINDALGSSDVSGASADGAVVIDYTVTVLPATVVNDTSRGAYGTLPQTGVELTGGLLIAVSAIILGAGLLRARRMLRASGWGAL